MLQKSPVVFVPLSFFCRFLALRCASVYFWLRNHLEQVKNWPHWMKSDKKVRSMVSLSSLILPWCASQAPSSLESVEILAETLTLKATICVSAVTRAWNGLSVDWSSRISGDYPVLASVIGSFGHLRREFVWGASVDQCRSESVPDAAEIRLGWRNDNFRLPGLMSSSTIQFRMRRIM